MEYPVFLCNYQVQNTKCIMKKILFTVLLSFAGTSIKGATLADDYEYPFLTFQTIDGATKTIAVESLTLTISDGQLIAQNGETVLTLNLAQMDKMYFSATPTGISATQASVALSDGIEVFSQTGILVGRFASVDQARSTLARGIYVIKTNEGAQKLSVK